MVMSGTEPSKQEVEKGQSIYEYNLNLPQSVEKGNYKVEIKMMDPKNYELQCLDLKFTVVG